MEGRAPRARETQINEIRGANYEIVFSGYQGSGDPLRDQPEEGIRHGDQDYEGVAGLD
jgi:hypothetical protein